MRQLCNSYASFVLSKSVVSFLFFKRAKHKEKYVFISRPFSVRNTMRNLFISRSLSVRNTEKYVFISHSRKHLNCRVENVIKRLVHASAV